MTGSSGIDVGDRIAPCAEILGINTLEGLVPGGVVWPETELPGQVDGDTGHVVLLAIRSVSYDTWNPLLGISRAVNVGIEFGSISRDNFNIIVSNDVGIQLLAILVIPLLFAVAFLEQILSARMETLVTVVADGRLADWLEGDWYRIGALPIYTSLRHGTHC